MKKPFLLGLVEMTFRLVRTKYSLQASLHPASLKIIGYFSYLSSLFGFGYLIKQLVGLVNIPGRYFDTIDHEFQAYFVSISLEFQVGFAGFEFSLIFLLVRAALISSFVILCHNHLAYLKYLGNRLCLNPLLLPWQSRTRNPSPLDHLKLILACG